MPKPNPHKIVQRIEQQPRTQTICAQPGCKWVGKVAQQGVCYSNEGEISEFSALEKHERELTAELAEMRKREGSKYVAALQAHYMGHSTNAFVCVGITPSYAKLRSECGGDRRRGAGCVRRSSRAP